MKLRAVTNFIIFLLIFEGSSFSYSPYVGFKDYGGYSTERPYLPVSYNSRGSIYRADSSYVPGVPYLSLNSIYSYIPFSSGIYAGYTGSSLSGLYSTYSSWLYDYLKSGVESSYVNRESFSYSGYRSDTLHKSDYSGLYDSKEYGVGTIDTDSYIAYDAEALEYAKEKAFNNKEIESYVPVYMVKGDDSLTELADEKVFVSTENLLEETGFLEEASPDVENSIIESKFARIRNSFVVRKVLRPFNFYFQKSKTLRKKAYGGFIVRRKGAIPYSDVSADGKTYLYLDAYHCEDKRHLKRFSDGDYEACEYGRASARLIENREYMEEIEDLSQCDSDSIFESSFRNIFEKLGGYSEEEIYRKALDKYYRSGTIRTIKKNLANRNKRRFKGHYGISFKKLISYVVKAANEFNIDPFLILSVISAESSFDPSAHPPGDGLGLMQVLPGTGGDIARWLGVKNFSTGKLYDPELNIRFGTYYLSRQLNTFRGNTRKALKAYNAGPGNVTGRGYSSYSSEVLSRYRAWNSWNNKRCPATLCKAPAILSENKRLEDRINSKA